MVGCVVLCALSVLLATESLAAAIPVAADHQVLDQLKLQASAWNLEKSNHAHDPTPDAALLQSLMSAKRNEIEYQAHRFAKDSVEAQDHILPYLASRFHTFERCFTLNPQSVVAAREQLSSLYPLPMSHTEREKAVAALDRIPGFSLLRNQFFERPDIVLQLLQGIQGTNLSKTILERFNVTQSFATPVFLELEGNSLTDSTFITSAIGPILDSAGSLSTGEIFEPLSSSVNSLSGGGGLSAMLGGSADSGSEALTSVSAGGESLAGQSMGQLVSSEISLGTSLTYASSVPTSASEALGTGAGSFTSFSTSAPSLLEISDTETSTTGGNDNGFCSGLMSTMVVLGFESGMEFIEAVPTLGDQYETFVLRSIMEQAATFGSKLEAKNFTSDVRSGIEKLMTAFFLGYNAVAAAQAHHLDEYVTKVIFAAILAVGTGSE